MILYHVTTPKKVRAYQATGAINPPVRGFDTPAAALFWAAKTGRGVILQIETDDEKTHLLPDHHNDFGRAWWTSEKQQWTNFVHIHD
jgi:hypothetical protein